MQGDSISLVRIDCKWRVFMSDMHGDSYDHNVDLVNGMQGEDKILPKLGLPVT